MAHPNIIGYYGSFIEDGVLNVVMEYSDNGSLFQLIQKCRQPFSEEQVLSFFVQLLLSLEHLHNKNILHRDLKTKNVFVTKKGQIKLGDFGLSKVLGSQTSFAHSAVGTPYYLSPELCEGHPYNQKSDIWAVGCIMYELTTFKHAFDATNLPALVMSIVQGKYNPISHQYSEELRTAIETCLRKNPGSRPSIESLLQMLWMMKQVELEQIKWESLKRDDLSKPYFSSGIVETPLSHRQVQGSPGHASTQVILSEVEEELQFEKLVVRMRQNLDISDKVLNRIPYFKTFRGSDCVDFLVQHLALQNREDAVSAAQRWMDVGVFYHVNRNDVFEDGDALYRFKEDEVGSILNMKGRNRTKQRSSIEIDRELRSRLSNLISRYTSESKTGTLVDYEGLALSQEFKDFTNFIGEMQTFDLAELSFSEKVTFFINIYNALVLHGFVVLGPPTTLCQRLHFYNHTCYRIGKQVYALNDIEHGILRGNQKPHISFRRVFSSIDPRVKNAIVVWDPRIYFCLVRGTKSCPKLRIYNPEELDEMLNEATREFCEKHIAYQTTSKSANPLSTKARVQIMLHAIFDWYRDDFGSSEGHLLKWLVPFLPSTRQKTILGAIENESFALRYSSFDWALNKKQIMVATNAPPGHQYFQNFQNMARPQSANGLYPLDEERLGLSSAAGKKPPPGVSPPPCPPPGGFSKDGVPLPPGTPPKFRPVTKKSSAF